MYKKIVKNISNVRFQLFIISIIGFFITLTFTPESQFICSIWAVALGFFLFLFLGGLNLSKKMNPIPFVMAIGILPAVLLIVNLFYSFLIPNSGIVANFFNAFFHLLILTSFVYIFLIFKELYFFKQKREVKIYFNTMAAFIFVSTITTLLPDKLSFIHKSFFVVSICLIAFNSIRISWIAFIVKKEKIYLLLLAVVNVILMISAAGILNTGIASKIPPLDNFITVMSVYGAIYFSMLFFTTLFHLPTAEAYDRRSQEISSLQYFSKLITQVLDIDELSDTVSEIALKITGANAAWLTWNTDDSYNISSLNNIGIVDSRMISDYYFKEFAVKQNTFTAIFYCDKVTSQQLMEKCTSLSASPIRTSNGIKGHIFTIKKAPLIYDEEDVNALNTFSDYASVAFENARLLKESIEKERIENELDLARQAQRKLIPIKNPEFTNLSVSSAFIPAFEVGGDYYDFFELEKNRLAFIIADVSGKGISASFIMAELKGIFTSLSTIINSPRELLSKANILLKNTLERKYFVSALYGVIDLETGKVVFSRAGHCPALLLKNGENIELKPDGLGLGLDFSDKFRDSLEEREIQLIEDDVIVLYTDGVTEAKNSLMQDFGDDLLRKILSENYKSDVHKISRSIIEEIAYFSKNTDQYDDITLVIFKWNEKKNKNGEMECQNSQPQQSSLMV
ncbi:MAG: PP2C family protein-serine/threonine phosphatase [Bacteroidota bacterium]|nr:PP2C family protein-serine/threonine phosphatase [Bacteroidota bacterium]